MTRLEAYAMLTHHALNCLWMQSKFQPDREGCCPKHCAPCAALQYLDNEGILDAVVTNWETYEDGTKVDYNDGNVFVESKVNRKWLYEQWRVPNGCGECSSD